MAPRGERKGLVPSRCQREGLGALLSPSLPLQPLTGTRDNQPCHTSLHWASVSSSVLSGCCGPRWSLSSSQNGGPHLAPQYAGLVRAWEAPTSPTLGPQPAQDWLPGCHLKGVLLVALWRGSGVPGFDLHMTVSSLPPPPTRCFSELSQCQEQAQNPPSSSLPSHDEGPGQGWPQAWQGHTVPPCRQDVPSSPCLQEALQAPMLFPAEGTPAPPQLAGRL